MSLPISRLDKNTALREYRRILARMSLEEMRTLAQNNDIELTGNRKREVIDVISNAFARPETIEAACTRLTSPARRLLTLFALLGQNESLNKYTLDSYAHQLDQVALTQNITPFLTELCQQGLLSHKDNFYTLPDLIADQLPPDTEFIVAYAGEPALASRSPFALLRPASHLLLTAQTDTLHTHPPAPPPSPRSPRARRGQKSPAGQQTAAPKLLTQETLNVLTQTTDASEAQLEYLAHIFIDIGLLQYQPGEPLQLKVSAFNKFLTTPPVEQVRQMLMATCTTTFWTELGLAGELVGEQIIVQPGTAQAAITALHNFLIQNRNFHLNMLRQLPSGRWADLEEYRELAWRLSTIGPTTERRRTRRGSRSREQNMHDAVVEAMFIGPWSWLGLIDLHYVNDQLTAFSLTELGEHLLGRHPDYQPPAELPDVAASALSITTDGTLHLDAVQARPELLNLLSLLADKAVINASSALSYRPTARGAARCFIAGWTPETITSHLEAAANTSLPATLRQNLATWWENYGRLHLYTNIALVEFTDDFALPELLASTSLSRHLLYRFSPRLIAVVPDQIETLIEEWSQKGYTPKLAENYPGSDNI